MARSYRAGPRNHLKKEKVWDYDGKGGSFELNQGYKNPKGDIHGNPYLEATVGSEKVRIPLK